MQRGVSLTRITMSKQISCSSISMSSAISSTEDISDFTCSTGLNFAHALIGRVSSIESTDLDDCGYSLNLIKLALQDKDLMVQTKAAPTIFWYNL